MATFHWHIKSTPKGGAESVSEYIWRTGRFNARTHEVVAKGYGNLPRFCGDDPVAYFRAADRHERSNGSASRHLVVHLPRELDQAAWVDLVEAQVKQDFAGKPYLWGIHVHPDQDGNAPQPHVHFQYSDRMLDQHDRPEEQHFRRANPAAPEHGGCRKDSGGKSRKQLTLEVIKRKESWAQLQNEALAKAGRPERVDPRKKKS